MRGVADVASRRFPAREAAPADGNPVASAKATLGRLICLRAEIYICKIRILTQKQLSA